MRRVLFVLYCAILSLGACDAPAPPAGATAQGLPVVARCPIVIAPGTSDTDIARRLVQADPGLASDPKRLGGTIVACGGQVQVQRVRLN